MLKTFKKGLAALMVVIMTLTSIPLQGFVDFELPQWFSFDAEAVDTETVVNEEVSLSGTNTVPADVEETEAEDNKSFLDRIALSDTSNNIPKEYLEILKESNINDSHTTDRGPMLFSVAPFSDEEEPTEENTAEEQPTSGTINETITWEFDSDTKTLTISGEGEIPAYYPKSYYEGEDIDESEMNLAPWESLMFDIEKLVIGEGITSIGDLNFYLAVNLKEITFNEGLKSIGRGCFAMSVDIRVLSFPSTLESIGMLSFAACMSLEELYLNEGLKSLGEMSFGMLYSLKKAYFPSTLEACDIEECTFFGAPDITINCTLPIELAPERLFSSEGFEYYIWFMIFEAKLDLGAILPAEELENLTEEELILIITDDFNKHFGTEYTFEEMVAIVNPILENFDDETQYCADKNLVVKLCENAGTHDVCRDKFIRHTVGDSEEECNCFVFSGDINDNISWSIDKESRTLTLSGSGEFPADMNRPGLYSYANDYIDNLVFDSESTITDIGPYSFRYMDIINVEVPGTVTIIKHYSFADCRKLSSFEFTGSLSSCAFWSHVFYGCSSLKELVLPERFYWIGDQALINSGIEKLVIKERNCHFDELDAIDTIPENTVIYGYRDSTAETYAKTNGRVFKSLEVFTVEDLVYKVGKVNGYDKDVVTITGYNGKAENIAIPEKLENSDVVAIDDEAFKDNRYIEYVTLPESVTIIGQSAFSNSTLKEITITNKQCTIADESAIPEAAVIYGYINSKAEEFANKYNRTFKAIDEFTVDNLEYEIGKLSGFDGDVVTITGYNGKAETVTIPEQIEGLDVVRIGNSAFRSNKYIRNLILSDTLKTIGYYAFENTLLETVKFGKNISKIDYNAFNGCEKLKSVYIADFETWNRIDFKQERANPLFYAENLYFGEELVTELVIPENITKIANYSFIGYKGLTSVTIPEGVTEIGIYAFAKTDIAEIVIPSTVKSMRYAFFGTSNLSDITFTQGLKAIPESAFNGCSGLTSITIPDFVTDIKSSAFYNCASLETVYIGSGINKMESSAFSDCENLKDVYIESISSWLGITFSGSTSNPLYYAENLYVNGVVLEELNVPETVTVIKDYAFYNYAKLSKVTLPQGITKLGDHAFYKSSVKEIFIPKTVTSIYRPFGSNEVLEKVVFEAGISKITYYAFESCKALTSVVIPEGVTEIAYDAFYNCVKLQNVVLPQSLVTIGNYAFYGCDSIIEIVIPDAVTNIGSYAFCSCDKLENVTIGKNVKTVNNGAFDSRNIKNVYAYDIASWAEINFSTATANPMHYGENFYLGGELIGSEIVIPEGVTRIGNYAFSEFDNLTSVTLSNTVTSVGNSSFYGCENLETVILSDSLTSIGSSAFYGCKKLNNLNLGNELKKINSYAFENCTSLTELVIPDSVKEIESSVFEGCESLKTVYATDIETWLGIDFSDETSNPLYYAEKLYFGDELATEIVIPEGITEISNCAFCGYKGLVSVALPSDLTTIGSMSFYKCTGITSVTIPDNVSSIKSNAFSDCENLKEFYVYGICNEISNDILNNANSDLTIYGYEGTVIHKYALNKNIAFEAVPDAEKPTVDFSFNQKNERSTYFDITVDVKDNADVEMLSLEYALLGENDFTVFETKKLATNKAEYKTYHKFYVNDLESGTYAVKVVAKDVNGNEASKTKYCNVDTTPPAVPTDIQAEGTPDYIYLIWRKNTVEKDFQNFNIYRSTSPEGEFNLARRISTIGYYDDLSTGIVQNSTYYYYVTSVDKLGNESEPSDIVSAMVASDNEKPEIYAHYIDDSSNIYNIGKKTLQISAYDNFKLKTVYAKYKLKGAEEWTDIGTVTVNSKSEIVSMNWNLEGIESGTYELLIAAIDEAGNVSEDYIAEVTVNGYSEVAETVLTAESGHRSVKLDWSYNGDKNAVESYSVYRKKNSSDEFKIIYRTLSTSFTDRLAPGEYIYKIVVEDIFGNSAESPEVSGTSVINDTENPQVYSTVSDLETIAGKIVAFDGTKSKDNDTIASYLWDFGDGHTSSKAYAEHSYKREGNYVATLTVTDEAGNSSAVSAEIYVIDLSLHPDKQLVQVNVSDSDGKKINGASIVVTENDNNEDMIITTDSNGLAEFILNKGCIYYLSAFKENSEYTVSQSVIDLTEKNVQPTKINTFSNQKKLMSRSSDDLQIYDTYVVDVILRSNYFKGEIKEPKEMTASEIKAAGIPVSRDVKLTSFEGSFTYNPIYADEEDGNGGLEEMPFTVYQGGGRVWLSFVGGGGSGDIWGWYAGSSDGRRYTPLQQDGNGDGGNNGNNGADDPVYVLGVSGNASCMGQVFQVDLIMLNSSSEDWMEDCTATLNLPSGVSVVACDKTQTIGTVPKSGSSIATWYVKGDKPGSYHFSVDVQGTIYPEPLIEYNKTYKTEHPIEVIDLTNSMTVNVIPPSSVEKDVPATVTVIFSSDAGVPLNFVQLNASTNDDSQTLEFDTFSGSATMTLSFTPTFTSTDREIIGGYLAESELKINDLPAKAYGGGIVEDEEEIDKKIETEIKLYKDSALTEEITELMCSAGSFFFINKDGKPEEIDEGQLYLDGKVEYIATSNLDNSQIEPLDNAKVKLSLPDGFSFERNKVVTKKEFDTGTILAGIGMKFKIPVYPIYSDKYKSDKTANFTVNASDGLRLSDNFKCSVDIKKNEDEGKIPFRATVGASNLVEGGEALTGTQNIKWNIKQFTGKTSTYNHDLAKTLMAFSASVYRKKDIEEALLNMGFSNIKALNFPSPDDQVIPAGKEDGCSYAFATKNIIVDKDKVSTIVLVLVRGTVQNEWYGNINVGTGPEHYSFKFASDMVKDDFAKYYNELKSKELISDDVRAGITGHSRGAAIANLLAGQNFNAGTFEGFDKNNVYAYTFATPNASKVASSGASYNNIFNIINPVDFVGVVPFNSWGFKRYGQDMHLNIYIEQGLDYNYGNYSFMLNIVNLYYSKKEFSGGRKYFGSNFENKFLMNNIGKFVPNCLVVLDKVVGTLVSNSEDYGDKPLFNSRLVEIVERLRTKVVNDSSQEGNYWGLLADLCSVVGISVSDMYNVVQVAVPILLRGQNDSISNKSYFVANMIVSGVDSLNKIFVEKYGTNLYDVTAYQIGKLAVDGMLSAEPENDALLNYFHCVETYMSWLECRTPMKKVDIGSSNRKVAYVNCPVDVEIYDSKGELVARVVNDEIDESIENMLETEVSGSDKTFILPLGEDYTLKITGYDDGTMDYYIDEYDAEGNLIRKVSFDTVTIEKGKTITATVDGTLKTAAENYALTMPDESVLQCTEDKTLQVITASVESGTEVEEGTKVELYSTDEVAKIYYTLDGSSPLDETNEARVLYDGPIQITQNTEILACAYMVGDSEEETELTLKAFSYTVKCKHKNLDKCDEVKATCEFYGSKECYFCEDCYKAFADENAETELTYSELVIEATGHSLVKIKAIPASCTTDGALEHYKCQSCSTTFSDSDGETVITDITVRATGHTGGTANCKDKAKCAVCGVEYGSVNANNHKSITPIKAVSATCTKTGLTEGKKCSACGKTTVAQKPVPVVSHSEVAIPAKKATYKATGLTEGKKCKACGKITLAQKTVAKLKLGKVTGLKAKKISVDKSSYVTLTWNKTAGAQKYEVYQQSGKKWKKIKTTSSTSLKVKKLSAGKSYKFKVRAILSGEPSGKYSSVLTVKVVPGKTTLSLKAGKKQLTASWKSVSGVTGYEVQYSTSKKFTKKTTKTLTLKSKSKKTTIKKLSKGKKYYVRVRAYKKIGNKIYYGSYSTAKSVKVK